MSRTSLHSSLLLLTLISVSVCSSQSRTASEATKAFGTWKLKSIYPTRNIEGPSPSEQEKLLGTTIVLSGDTLKACGRSVPVRTIEVNQISSSDFLDNNRVRLSGVGIEAASVTEIVVNHRQAGTCFDVFPLPGQDIYIKDKNEIVILFEVCFIAGQENDKNWGLSPAKRRFVSFFRPRRSVAAVTTKVWKAICIPPNLDRNH